MRLNRIVLSFTLAFLAAFSVVAFAASTVNPESTSLPDLLLPVYQAFARGEHLYAGMLALIAAVAILKRYAPDWKGISGFVHGDFGGALLTLVASFAGGMITAGVGEGTPVSWLMVKTATSIAIGAIGIYVGFKKLVLVPFLLPLAAKHTWLQPILNLVIWIFEKPAKTPDEVIKDAEDAGQKAVDANPAGGTKSIVGDVREVE